MGSEFAWVARNSQALVHKNRETEAFGGSGREFSQGAQAELLLIPAALAPAELHHALAHCEMDRGFVGPRETQAR